MQYILIVSNIVLIFYKGWWVLNRYIETTSYCKYYLLISHCSIALGLRNSILCKELACIILMAPTQTLPVVIPECRSVSNL